MGVADRFRNIFKSSKPVEQKNNETTSYFSKGISLPDAIEKRGGNALRDLALPFDSYTAMVGQLERKPLYRWSYNFLLDLANGSDLLRAIIKTITDEVFKNGLEIEERFVSKCLNPDCGYEMQDERKKCDICGSKTRSPDIKEEFILKKYIQKQNRFAETFIQTLRVCDGDVNVFDNAFILLAKRYEYNSSGDIIGSQVFDTVRLSPDKTMLIISAYGMGRDELGRYAYFCPEHRETVSVKDKKSDNHKCDICHKQMLEAWYASGSEGSTGGASTTGNKIYYGKREVYHAKRWSLQEGYGMSPLIAVYKKVLALMKMDDVILEAYSLQRTPKALLIIRGKADNIMRAFEWTMQKSRENPNMIFPLVVEGTDTGSKRIMEIADFSLKPQEMEMMQSIEKIREYVGLVYGVLPMFSTGQSGTGSSNEGLQITVTNRTIAESQRVWNSVLEWMLDIISIKDYIVRLVPNEIEDTMRKIDIEQERTDMALKLSELGFEVNMVRRKDGTIDYRYEKKRSNAGKNINVGENFNPEEYTEERVNQNNGKDGEEEEKV